MDASPILANWALVVAIVPVSIVVVAVVLASFWRSARGRLTRVNREHQAAERVLRDARRNTAKAVRKLEKLESKADNVKPRELQEAREAVTDCRALEKILNDKTQVTMNHLRRVIFEEFPPASHEKMRAKFLPQDVEDGRPFTF